MHATKKSCFSVACIGNSLCALEKLHECIGNMPLVHWKVTSGVTVDFALQHVRWYFAARSIARDEAMTELVHADLRQADFLPNAHLLDASYMTVPTLATSLGRSQRMTFQI